MNMLTLDNYVVRPTKVVCIGRNYVEHIQELNNEIPTEPVVFLKPNSAISKDLISGTDEPIHYEGELCFMVQSGQLAAVGFGLDLTKRETQSRLKGKGLPWERAKAFDGSAVFSDFVSYSDDISTLSLKLFINDELIQQGGVELMMYKPETILAEVTSFLTLQDTDVIMTGTPKGVGVIEKGARFVGQVFSGDQLLVEGRWVAS
ncbi:fumarylacetoacetate hydrolase family protein [Leucothrix arctica]|uniref:2-keto-4-pentenoate hydratase n=1 Tax=Leucothrix arctica TaxID=1481894 RepID=A0A317CGN4_9GAMM|nr:fumarylacetoacetate hydrolase family protein [Leucothrix arctica]PWQ97547.1 2-keto-4-pentenoate hydratase [Leucothrix arctica]